MQAKRIVSASSYPKIVLQRLRRRVACSSGVNFWVLRGTFHINGCSRDTELKLPHLEVPRVEFTNAKLIGSRFHRGGPAGSTDGLEGTPGFSCFRPRPMNNVFTCFKCTFTFLRSCVFTCLRLRVYVRMFLRLPLRFYVLFRKVSVRIPQQRLSPMCACARTSR